MIAEIAAIAGALIGAGGLKRARRFKGESAFYQQAHSILLNVVAERDQTITNLQHKCSELATEVDKYAAARTALSRAGGIARGLKLKREREAAARTTVAALESTPLRPRKDVVAGARQGRRQQATA